MKAVAPGAVWDPSQMSIMYSDVYVDREPDKRTSDNVIDIDSFLQEPPHGISNFTSNKSVKP